MGTSGYSNTKQTPSQRAQAGTDWSMIALWILLCAASVPVWGILADADYWPRRRRTYVMFVALSTTLVSLFMVPYWMVARLRNFWRHGQAQNVSPAARTAGLVPALAWLGLWGGACALAAEFSCDAPNTGSTVCNWNGAILAMSLLSSVLWLAMTYLLILKTVRTAVY
ncbi:hypothetical protein SeLEV6574_g00391 [Synchytrium endobioticum]|nr:hypothetical protein SeLEV6574_g00391 [Synchytrium endobioticum]